MPMPDVRPEAASRAARAAQGWRQPHGLNLRAQGPILSPRETVAAPDVGPPCLLVRVITPSVFRQGLARSLP